MRILKNVMLLMVGMLAIVAGCSENTEPVGLQTAHDPTLLPSAESLMPLAKPGCGIVRSVVGEGTYFVSQTGSNVGMAYSVRFAVAALQFKDGTCAGRYVMLWLDEENKVNVKIVGAITGMKFYGNVAMLAGEVQNEILVDFFGPQVWRQVMVLTDNGGKHNPEVDRMSNPWVTSDGVWPGEFTTYWAYDAEQFLTEMAANLGGTGTDYPLARGQITISGE